MRPMPILWSLAVGFAVAVPIRAEGPPSGDSDAVAIVGGAKVGRAQLEELAREGLARIRAEEYAVRRRALERHVERLLLEQEAAERKVTVAELTRAEVDAKAKAVTEEEVRGLYEQVKERLQGVPEPQALQQAKDALRRQRVDQRRAELVKELKAKRSVRILLEPPRVSLETEEGPDRGPRHAPVTVVVFSDFQCPYCAQAADTLRELGERYGDRLRVVYRDFPLPFHRDAPKAAEAAACAGEQGRFWAMHDTLFANQGNLRAPDLKRYATELGLKQPEFDQCLDSGRREQVWRQGREQAARLGVTGTPAFFVNGRPLSGAQPVPAFVELIEEELERVGTRAKGDPAAASASERGGRR